MADETSADQLVGESTAVVMNTGGAEVGDKKNDNGDIDSSLRSESCMAKGLSTLISSVIKDFDTTAEATISSQNQLCSSIDRLTAELDQLLDDAPLPFIMQHGARISVVRKRVISLNSVLKSIQRRLDNIDRLMSTGSPAPGNS